MIPPRERDPIAMHQSLLPSFPLPSLPRSWGTTWDVSDETREAVAFFFFFPPYSPLDSQDTLHVKLQLWNVVYEITSFCSFIPSL